MFLFGLLRLIKNVLDTTNAVNVTIYLCVRLRHFYHKSDEIPLIQGEVAEKNSKGINNLERGIFMFMKSFFTFRQRVISKLSELEAQNLCNTNEYTQLKIMLTRLNQMLSFVFKGNWARKTTREKYRFWLEHGYNYALTARQYKTSDKCARVLVTRADTVLEKIIHRPLCLFSQGNVQDGWIEFCFNIHRLDVQELYGRPVCMIMPQPSDLNYCYSLQDCKPEIKFLRSYSSYEIRAQLKALDKQKLSYLLALVSCSDPEFLDERKQVIKATADPA